MYSSTKVYSTIRERPKLRGKNSKNSCLAEYYSLYLNTKQMEKSCGSMNRNDKGDTKEADQRFHCHRQWHCRIPLTRKQAARSNGVFCYIHICRVIEL